MNIRVLSLIPFIIKGMSDKISFLGLHINNRATENSHSMVVVYYLPEND
jgi:hypothetical protein